MWKSRPNNRGKATTGSFVCGVVWMCMQFTWLWEVVVLRHLWPRLATSFLYLRMDQHSTHWYHREMRLTHACIWVPVTWSYITHQLALTIMMCCAVTANSGSYNKWLLSNWHFAVTPTSEACVIKQHGCEILCPDRHKAIQSVTWPACDQCRGMEAGI